MKKHISTILILLSAVLANAQNFNPQVQVTNSYLSKGSGTLKSDYPLSVPDSVMRINYSFDYSVFDSPYKGAYDFRPYEISMAPQSVSTDRFSLNMKAGIGYPVHPELSAVMSTLLRNRSSITFFQELDGYTGEYWTVVQSIENPVIGIFNERYAGYDLSETAGIRGRSVSASGKETVAEISYRGLFNKDFVMNDKFHSMSASLAFGDKLKGNSLRLRASYSTDCLSYPLEDAVVGELYAGADGTFTVNIPGHSFNLATDYDLGYYLIPGGFADKSTAVLSISPHYVWSNSRIKARAGFKLEYADRMSIAPDINFSAIILEGTAEFFAGATGGIHVNSYSSLKEYDHFFTPAYSKDFMCVGKEKWNLHAGLRGTLAPGLEVSMKTGYASYLSSPFESFGYKDEQVLLGKLIFSDYRLSYTDIALSWKSKSVTFDSEVSIRKTYFDETFSGIDLSPIRSDSRLQYNFRKRIFAEISCITQGEQAFHNPAGELKALPATVDLGVKAEYRFLSPWSIWIKGGNLLNESIHTTPIHVDRGINFTAGICLSL